MLPILYENVEAGIVPAHYGVGVLRDCLSCVVTEERNGAYEMELSYPASGIHAADIVPNCVIKVKPNPTDNPQLFRVYKIGKTMAGVFTVSAHHVSYDLSGTIITNGVATDIAGACEVLQGASQGYTIATNKGTIAPFKISEPSSVRSWFGGKSGSLLDVYGGEWHWDNFTLRLLDNRGADRGVYIRYGKNLTDLSQEMDISNLATSITPYYKDEESDTTIVGDAVATGLTLNPPKNIAIDFSSDIDEESETPIRDQLEALAVKYIANNELGAAVSTITLNFVQLHDLTERIDLCDIAHIDYEALGITVALKCIATTWDALEERYTSTKFGKGSTDITDTILKTDKEVKDKPTITAMQGAITKATETITGNRGGHVILHSDDNGEPYEILISDNADLTQAVKVWRWNKNGLGYSSTGYNGQYGTAITANGEIVADFIKTGTLNADFIKAGVISDAEGNSSIDMTNGVAKMRDLNAIYGFNILTEGDEDLRAAFRAMLRSSELIMSAAAVTNDPYVEITASQPAGELVESAWLILRHLGEVENVRLEAGANGGSFTISSREAKPAIKGFTGYAGGVLNMCDLEGASKATLWVGGNSDGVLNLSNGDGEETITAIGQTGAVECDHVKQRNRCRAITTSGITSGSATYTGVADYSVFMFMGFFTSGGSLNSCYVPAGVLTSSNQRFIFSDETDYVTFNVKLEGDTLTVAISSKSKTTAKISAIYGLY